MTIDLCWIWFGGVLYHAMMGLPRLPLRLWWPWMMDGALWPWFLFVGLPK